jgi:short-subunit dehydrogenase
MNPLIVVTGGTRGIGKAIAMKFAQAGKFDVITCSRNQDNLDQFKNEFRSTVTGAECFLFRCDLEKRADVKAFIDFVKSSGRRVDVLVNNAGVFIPGAILQEEEGVFEKQMNLNLASSYYITRGIVPDMVKAGRGTVYNICSTASITAYINGGSYCISKFAMLGMSKVLRQELKNTAIRVTSVLPGATLTDSWAGANLPEERFMTAESVADTIYAAYLLPSNTVVEEILIRPQLGDIG